MHEQDDILEAGNFFVGVLVSIGLFLATTAIGYFVIRLL